MTNSSCNSTTDGQTVSTPQHHLPSVPTLTLTNILRNFLYCLAPPSSYYQPPCPLGTSTPHARPHDSIPTFITPSAPPSIPPVWEYVIAVLMTLPPTTAEGHNMRAWVIYHSLTSLEDILMWELDTLQYDAITVCFPSRDTTKPNSLVSLNLNSIRHIIMLRKYIHHLVQDSHLSVSTDATDHALEPDHFLHTTSHQFMSWKLNAITTSSPSPPPSVTASDPRAAPSPPSCTSQILNFKRGIKRDISAYPALKDEKYYESFKRSVLVTPRAHDCDEILQPTLSPRGDADSLELFRLKNDFMYSVFNKCLLSDIGKTNVRKHLEKMNAQRVWEGFATHMTTSSKGKAEKHRLHTYFTNTVLAKSWKGTTEQFILHFNEEFRQLDEVSPPEESLPNTTSLTLLQTAVHNIPELRMVETMEEFISLSSSTPVPTLGYENYLTLLQHACIRYVSNLKSRPSPASRAAYQHDLSHDHHDNPYPQDYSSSGTIYGGIDMPAEEFYQIHTTNRNRPPTVSNITRRKPTTAPPLGRHTPRRCAGPIFLPANIYKLLSDVAIKELKKHNATTRSTPQPKRAVNTHDTDPHQDQTVEKLQFSLFLISCSQVILSSSYSPGIFLKDCLFTCIFHSL